MRSGTRGGQWGEWIWLGLALAGCEPVERPYDPSQGTESFTGEAGALTEGGPPASAVLEVQASEGQGASLGVTCSTNAECDSGSCADGFCCSEACTAQCESCDVPGFEGTCGPSAGDELCPALRCPEVTECMGYDDDVLVNNCQANGECRAEVNCVAQPKAEGTVCGEEGAGRCDSEGRCQVPNKALLGAVCEVDDECSEGHCVEGLCCDSACDGLCQECGQTGRCNATPNLDVRCEPVQCPEDNVCLDFPETVAAGECGGLGVCQGGEACREQALTLRPDAQCACDALGNCQLRSGVSCERDPDCGDASFCERTATGTSVCCQAACAPGLFCSSNGDGCVECEGSAVTCDGSVARSCDNGSAVSEACANGCTSGVGCNVAAPVGFSCEQSACQLGGVCQSDISGELRCCARDCFAEGKVCATDGSCQCAPGEVAAGNSCFRQTGDPCQDGEQCQDGRCVDGVCCSAACNGFCEQCQQGSGACVAVPAGQQDDSCNNTHECTGRRNDCRARTGESCSTTNGSDCRSNRCTATAGGGAAVCCAQNCVGSTPFCSSNGQRCVQCEVNSQCAAGCNTSTGFCNPLGNGESCGQDSECASGRCRNWFVDADADDHGDAQQPVKKCGPDPREDLLSNQASGFRGAILIDDAGARFAAVGDDCCDDLGSMFPGNTNVIAGTIDANCPEVLPNDANCDGVEVCEVDTPAFRVCI